MFRLQVDVFVIINNTFVSVILCFINCMSIKWAEQIQVSMTVVKLVAAGIIMAGGFYSLAQGIYYYKHII